MIFPYQRVTLSLTGLLLICCINAIADDGLIVNDDFFLGVWSPYARNWQTEVPICIWSEDGGQFRVIATGLSPGRQFAVSNDLGNMVRYDVTVRSGRRFRLRERLRQSIPSRRYYGSSPTGLCTSGASARVRVRINKRQIDRAIPAIYTDTLLLVLSPL